MAVWMPEGEWLCAWKWEDAAIFCRRLSSLTYRLADQQLQERTGNHTESVWEATASTLLICLVQLFCPMDAVSGVNMPSHLRDVALSGQSGAGLPAVSFTNTSVPSSPTPGAGNRGCENGALMDSFGIFLQGLLAVVAFSTLMCEYDQRSAVCQISDSSCWWNRTIIQ